MRIPDRVITEHIQTSLGLNTDRLLKIEEQLSSGRRINRPSDDPAGASAAMRIRTDLAMNDQYMRTVDAAKSRLSAADSALSSLTDVVQRARELTVQAGGGTLSGQQLTAIADELNQLLQHAVQIGNTNFGGQFIFAGTKTTTAPFAAAGDTPATVTYNGNDTPINLDLGQNAQVRVDVPGDQVFLPVTDVLIKLRDALTSGDANAATSNLGALDSALDGVLRAQGAIGARVNRLDSLGQRMDGEQSNLQGLQSQLEDIDVTDTIVRLNAAQNVYQAALGAAARVIQPTLVDFLR
jgi:flagellar hook-associated protein 3 FlgL